MRATSENRVSNYLSAVSLIADHLQTSRVQILDPSGRPVRSSPYNFARAAAKKTGSMRNWTPRQVTTEYQGSYEREFIASRAIDLVNSNPQASGVVDSMATTIVGAGLRVNPNLDEEVLGLSEKRVEKIESAQASVFDVWAPFADVTGRLSFGAMQYLAMRSMVQFGEYLFLVHMMDDPTRPYMLALQSIHPMRLSTPGDLVSRDDIKDGVEIDSYGAPKAYWIKTAAGITAADVSENYKRITAKAGHRIKVIHGYAVRDPEQFRGISLLAPAMKLFRDFADYLDAELVSNIVTSAFSLFISVAASTDPVYPATNLATITDTAYKSDASEYDQRYQEMVPGLIMYGSEGEQPHPIQAQRPGVTFKPFVKVVGQSIAMSLGIPYPVLFKDFDGMNFASYRSAMLEAWRVYKQQRTWLGSGLCQPVYRMLIEEAYLLGHVKIAKFYERMYHVTRADWIGPPKGQIEPIKEVQADVLAIQNNLKSRTETSLEANRDHKKTVKQLAAEQKELKAQGLDEAKFEMPEEPATGGNNESD